MLHEHGLRRQLGRDHHARLADDARRTRSQRRFGAELDALLAHLRLEPKRSRRQPVDQRPIVQE